MRRLALAASVLALATACSGGSTDTAAPSASASATTSPAAVTAPPVVTTPAAPDPLETPTVGQCWTAPPESALDSLHYAGKATPCAGVHALETYSVVPLKGALAASKAYPGDRLEAQANAVCVDNAGGNDAPRFTGSKYPDYTLVQEYAWIPSPALWAKGARWLRCDVSIHLERLRPLRGSLKGTLARPLTPADRYCVVGFEQESLVVGCDQPHDFEEVGVALAGRPSDPYPAGFLDIAADRCKRAAQAYVGTTAKVSTRVFAPKATGWNNIGIRQITCSIELSKTSRGSVRNAHRVP